MAYRQGQNAHVDILSVNVTDATGPLYFHVTTEAHDQNQWARCSMLVLTFYDAADNQQWMEYSPHVPRSGSYQPFEWEDGGSTLVVTAGGRLELTGFGCWGGGIHTRNTKATFTVDDCGKATGVGVCPSFLNLHYDASSSANSYNGRTLGCIPSFDAGDLDTEVKWTKLAWFNEDLLQIDALDTTYATTVSGSDKIGYSAPTIASGYDCAGSGSTRGMGVIDLRGTPYVIAGVSDTPCYQSNSGGTSSTCFQWITNGWNAAVKVTCSNGNQRCVVQCGGFSGGCSPINNILQLEWAPASPSP